MCSSYLQIVTGRYSGETFMSSWYC